MKALDFFLETDKNTDLVELGLEIRSLFSQMKEYCWLHKREEASS